MHRILPIGALAVVLAVLCAFNQLPRKKPPLVLTVLSEAADVEAPQQRPRVLIYHTHTWEAYEMTESASYVPTETWRTKDNAHNMVCVGRALAEELTARGFDVVHDTTAFEPPNLSASYQRSLKMLEARLDAGEQYDYLFDLHRDAFCGL